MLSENDLHPYQLRAADFIERNPSSFLILGLGLGKTVATLTAIRNLLDQCMVRRVLVIAPLRVGLHVWPAEAAKWRHLSGLRLAVAIGSQCERLSALDQWAPLTVINRENVKWLVDHQAKSKLWPWDMVVIDESSSFKSHSAQRFKALRRVRSKVDRVVLMTATPSANSLLELWAQAYLLDMGKALGRTFTGFRSAYFESDYMGFKWTPRPGTDKFVQEALRPLSMVMRTEDYLSLPPKVERIHTIALPPAAVSFYHNFERECFAEVEGVELTALSAGVLAGKLQQAAQGAVYSDTGPVLEIHQAKLDVLEDLVEAAQEPVLVAYTYRHDLARIKARIKNAVDVKEPGAIDVWNAGRIPVLCAHPASAGHGLNLQAGGSQLVWFGQTWSGELDSQMTGRLYRQGQTKPVIIHRFIAAGTIDELIFQALKDKSSIQDMLINAIRTKKLLT